MSDFDKGYRDPRWHEIEEKIAEIARLSTLGESCDLTKGKIEGLKGDVLRIRAEIDIRNRP
jgi:hypothetical protein